MCVGVGAVWVRGPPTWEGARLGVGEWASERVSGCGWGEWACMGESWASHGRVMGESWARHGRVMGEWACPHRSSNAFLSFSTRGCFDLQPQF